MRNGFPGQERRQRGPRSVRHGEQRHCKEASGSQTRARAFGGGLGPAAAPAGSVGPCRPRRRGFRSGPVSVTERTAFEEEHVKGTGRRRPSPAGPDTGLGGDVGSSARTTPCLAPAETPPRGRRHGSQPRRPGTLPLLPPMAGAPASPASDSGVRPRFLPLPFPDGRLPAACLLMRTWVCGRARLQGMLGTRAAFPWGTGGS